MDANGGSETLNAGRDPAWACRNDAMQEQDGESRAPVSSFLFAKQPRGRLGIDGRAVHDAIGRHKFVRAMRDGE